MSTVTSAKVEVIDWDTEGETRLAKSIKLVFQDNKVAGSWTLWEYGVDDFCLYCDCVTITVCRVAFNNGLTAIRCKIDNNGETIVVERPGYWANILGSALKAW